MDDATAHKHKLYYEGRLRMSKALNDMLYFRCEICNHVVLMSQSRFLSIVTKRR